MNRGLWRIRDRIADQFVALWAHAFCAVDAVVQLARRVAR